MWSTTLLRLRPVAEELGSAILHPVLNAGSPNFLPAGVEAAATAMVAAALPVASSASSTSRSRPLFQYTLCQKRRKASLVVVADENKGDAFIDKLVAEYSAMKPHPLSLQQILDMLEPSSYAEFIRQELPIRYAERIRSIQELAGWEYIPALVDVHSRHLETFEDIVCSGRYEGPSSLDDPVTYVDFVEIVRRAAFLQSNVQQLVAQAMHSLHAERPQEFSAEFVDGWLDDFLLNWIGTEMLLAHYLAVVCKDKPTGIVEPRCDVAEVCREVAFTMQCLCMDLHGRVPQIHVKSRSAVEEDKRAPCFSYIPSFLKYILTEILKNASRATLESTGDERRLLKRPINVLVCADERRVAIRVSDLGRGIPFDVWHNVWSYMYSTARKHASSHHNVNGGATPLAGYGVGLPLSRLYTRYLGGSLDLVSWPGYGTDVQIFLPRLSSEQVEVVPDQDN
mmetsp:Transcript_79930/g.158343  ORF Transcript_79930/g.158343 Transcript_79930/m.158343 type:complete len:452 (-) Transcript_79930:287-1642(-)